jgi:hypothetical protein
MFKIRCISVVRGTLSPRMLHRNLNYSSPWPLCFTLQVTKSRDTLTETACCSHACKCSKCHGPTLHCIHSRDRMAAMLVFLVAQN